MNPTVWFFRALFWVAMLLALTLMGKMAKAEIRVLEADEVSLIGEWFDAHRDPYIPEVEQWTYGAGLGSKFTLVGSPAQKWRLFFDPTLYFKADRTQIREGQLNYSFGGELLQRRGVRFYRYHESRHVLEYGRGKHEYPITDSWKLELVWRMQ